MQACQTVPKAGVKTTQAQLGGHYHETEQQGDSRNVDCVPGRLGTDLVCGQESNGPQERHTCSIERRPGNPSKHHSHIDSRKNGEHYGIHENLLHKPQLFKWLPPRSLASVCLGHRDTEQDERNHGDPCQTEESSPVARGIYNIACNHVA